MEIARLLFTVRRERNRYSQTFRKNLPWRLLLNSAKFHNYPLRNFRDYPTTRLESMGIAHFLFTVRQQRMRYSLTFP